jgi:hypothetical protein
MYNALRIAGLELIHFLELIESVHVEEIPCRWQWCQASCHIWELCEVREILYMRLHLLSHHIHLL